MGNAESSSSRKSCCGEGKTPQAATAHSLAAHFSDMLGNCLTYAETAKKDGRPIVGIMCEFTPRELILAAGGVPVCLCGGDLSTIAPAEEILPANLCPLIKSTFGYHLTRGNPFLEMADLLIAETTCDGKKKMYELMAQSRAMHVLELPQKPDQPSAMAHWREELGTCAISCKTATTCGSTTMPSARPSAPPTATARCGGNWRSLWPTTTRA